MDDETKQQIREALLARWKRQPAALESEIRIGEETSQPQAEMIDIAQTLEQLGRDASLAEQGRRELAAIERALAKMVSGGFGVCEECGEEIPVKRLLVVPEARLCANCQALEEKNLRSRLAGGTAR
jgi:DnaK suppressor protein